VKRLFFSLALAGCQSVPAPIPSLSPAPVQVEVTRVVRRDVDRVTELPGDARPKRVAPIYAKVSGQLKELRVDIGDRVQQGQVLALLEAPELTRDSLAASAQGARADAEALSFQAQASAEVNQAQSLESEASRSRWQAQAQAAQVDQARARLNLSQASYLRFQSVYDTDAGLIARQQLETAFAEKEADRARLEAAIRLRQASLQEVSVMQRRLQAARGRQQSLQWQSRGAQQLSLARQQESLRAQDWLEYTQLKAPFDGVVSRRYLDQGALVQSSAQNAQANHQPVLEVMDDRVLRVTLRVPEADAPFVRPGRNAEIRSDALPDRVLTGRVTRVALALGSDRCMQTEIDLPNSARQLQAGMFLKVRLSLQTHTRVLAIPGSALLDEKGKLSVFVLEAGKAVKKSVEVGFRNPDWVEVQKGLSGTEEVVCVGKEQLVDGASLQVKR